MEENAEVEWQRKFNAMIIMATRNGRNKATVREPLRRAENECLFACKQLLEKEIALHVFLNIP